METTVTNSISENENISESTKQDPCLILLSATSITVTILLLLFLWVEHNTLTKADVGFAVLFILGTTTLGFLGYIVSERMMKSDKNDFFGIIVFRMFMGAGIFTQFVTIPELMIKVVVPIVKMITN